MSAIRMTCDRCGGTYIAGVVGRTPWPPHRCPAPRESCPSCGCQLNSEPPYECFGCGMTPREWELERKGLA